MPALNETSHMVETCRPNAPTYSSQHEEILDDSYENFITRESVQEMMNKLRNIGVKKHRIIHLGWGGKNRQTLVDHLGFKPREWDAFAIDSLPPESLLEGLPIALDDETSLIDVLGSRLRLLT